MDVSRHYLLQNIFRAYSDRLDGLNMPVFQRKAVDAITRCRSGELGTSYYQCAKGHATTEVHHSCRHRSCYLCARRARHDWIEAQKRRLLNCEHFHLVFTLPSEYRVLWQYNSAWFTRALFNAVQQTVMTLMADERHHGVTPGLLLTLHTWGRQLNLHPHIHCLVTAGGLDGAGRWKSTGDYLMPIRMLKALYRGKLQAHIKAAFEAGELQLPPDSDRATFFGLYRQAYSKAWSVRVEEQYRHGKGVVLYLSRYMKGGPLHPAQIRRCDAEGIGFVYKDHRDQRRKRKTLTPLDFLHRLLLHVPPQGVHTVRHYGLYAAASRDRRNRCREQLGDLRGVEAGGRASNEAMVTLTCRDCGGALQRRYWTRRRWVPKGISSIKGRTGGYVQQGVEAVIAKGCRGRDPCGI